MRDKRLGVEDQVSQNNLHDTGKSSTPTVSERQRHNRSISSTHTLPCTCLGIVLVADLNQGINREKELE